MTELLTLINYYLVLASELQGKPSPEEQQVGDRVLEGMGSFLNSRQHLLCLLIPGTPFPIAVTPVDYLLSGNTDLTPVLRERLGSAA